MNDLHALEDKFCKTVIKHEIPCVVCKKTEFLAGAHPTLAKLKSGKEVAFCSKLCCNKWNRTEGLSIQDTEEQTPEKKDEVEIKIDDSDSKQTPVEKKKEEVIVIEDPGNPEKLAKKEEPVEWEVVGYKSIAKESEELENFLDKAEKLVNGLSHEVLRNPKFMWKVCEFFMGRWRKNEKSLSRLIGFYETTNLLYQNGKIPKRERTKPSKKQSKKGKQQKKSTPKKSSVEERITRIERIAKILAFLHFELLNLGKEMFCKYYERSRDILKNKALLSHKEYVIYNLNVFDLLDPTKYSVDKTAAWKRILKTFRRYFTGLTQFDEITLMELLYTTIKVKRISGEEELKKFIAEVVPDTSKHYRVLYLLQAAIALDDRPLLKDFLEREPFDSYSAMTKCDILFTLFKEEKTPKNILKLEKSFLKFRQIDDALEFAIQTKEACEKLMVKAMKEADDKKTEYWKNVLTSTYNEFATEFRFYDKTLREIVAYYKEFKTKDPNSFMEFAKVMFYNNPSYKETETEVLKGNKKVIQETLKEIGKQAPILANVFWSAGIEKDEKEEKKEEPKLPSNDIEIQEKIPETIVLD